MTNPTRVTHDPAVTVRAAESLVAKAAMTDVDLNQKAVAAAVKAVVTTAVAAVNAASAQMAHANALTRKPTATPLKPSMSTVMHSNH
jgi:hypothetical protein